MDMRGKGSSGGELSNEGGPSITSIASLLKGDVVDVLDLRWQGWRGFSVHASHFVEILIEFKVDLLLGLMHMTDNRP